MLLLLLQLLLLLLLSLLLLKKLWLLLPLALVFAAGIPDGERWWSHVKFLADDKLEGRNTGSEGHRVAARYVAEEQEGSAVARRFAAELRRVQDVIGAWHDWALLSELAEKVLGGDAAVTAAMMMRRGSSLKVALRVRERPLR